MQVTTIGLDIAKNVFQVHGIDAAEKVVVRKQLRRGHVMNFFEALPRCLVGMEACASAHYWARELTKLGHEVRLMPAKDVKAYIKRNKNDAADAEAICEAVRRPTMRFVGGQVGRAAGPANAASNARSSAWSALAACRCTGIRPIVMCRSFNFLGFTFICGKSRRGSFLPSAISTASAPRIFLSRLDGWPVPSPTDASPLASRPTMHVRGRCGSLLLHRIGLSPTTPCRSPGAQRFELLTPRFVVCFPALGRI
jgi:Transposase